MTQAVGDVGCEGRHDTHAARRIEHHHRARVNQAIYSERDQASCPASLTMRPHEVVGMLVRRNRGHGCDAEDRKRR
jgi:hypothetical protein